MGRLFRRGGPDKDETSDPLEFSARAVEQILAQIGVDAAAARMDVESGYGWNFLRGSALIEVYLSPEERGYLQVLAPIMHLPPSNLLALYRRLLELNLELTNAALGLHEDVVYLYHERLLEGLDASEADVIIRRLARVADELDDALVEEFGGRLYGQG
ncbi:MAG: YbjN domain-containing protein [Chloroflexota bacterium]|nr:YbjN domain-containing protein [Chloroflexota bacterium]